MTGCDLDFSAKIRSEKQDRMTRTPRFILILVGAKMYSPQGDRFVSSRRSSAACFSCHETRFTSFFC